ncbi:helix-turn-helix transcriptional regulator [Robiginitalea sediminis]|uniref:helix-turn-helix transcriptional regulator n=1 Tax=Robiginitalea sediminis TaxID=1982593 RepID=UPI000B4BFE01|nr:helix-turn-helix transcriptional regulator [Robiginitalea sediminis]
MKKGLIILLGIAGFPCFGQFHFSGELGQEHGGKAVYLSLVEDYRKMGRPYADQIIGQQWADPEGRFAFAGDQLSGDNRIYRIHLDDCEVSGSKPGHILQHCPGYKSLLFIAHNQDTLVLPPSFDLEIFCEIQSTNSSSGDLLEVERLKEEMAFDLMEVPTRAGTRLNMDRWFRRLQEFGENSQEPLTELSIYSFLSDRANETRAFFLEDLAYNPYYDKLAARLEERYPEAPFTRLYGLELQADRNTGVSPSQDSPQTLWLLGGLLFASMGANIYLVARRRRPSAGTTAPLEQLTAQEKRIARGILQEASNKEIASELFISVSTVKTHINNLYKKLGVRNRDELKKRLQE